MPSIRVWDLPTRVFHWLLFLGVVVVLITGDEGEEGVLSIHQIFGFLVMALLIFRLAWGVVGTRHARFTSFIRGPKTVLGYARALVRLARPQSAWRLDDRSAAGRPRHRRHHRPVRGQRRRRRPVRVIGLARYGGFAEQRS
ncbi:MAG: hypothetical protein EXQ99_08200 [Alphaproteobacteria bacterium]|nr:hypothetical protein [Alphaproteobacteria bacterium]